MATVLLLRHREDADRFPPVRLTLTGATLVTDVGRRLTSTSIQALPSREAAQDHCVFRRDPGSRSNLTRAAVPTAPGQPFQ
jgi:hypothetical protein